MFMLNVCVLCKVMCISDVCTFFDCQVPISNSAMRGDCKWNLRRRNRSIWGWERNEDVVIFALTQSGFLCFISMGPAKSSIFNISIHPHSYSMSYMNMDISKQKHLKLPIQCFNVFNLTALSPHEYQPLFSYKWTWTLDSVKLPTRS